MAFLLLFFGVMMVVSRSELAEIALTTEFLFNLLLVVDLKEAFRLEVLHFLVTFLLLSFEVRGLDHGRCV